MSLSLLRYFILLSHWLLFALARSSLVQMMESTTSASTGMPQQGQCYLFNSTTSAVVEGSIFPYIQTSTCSDVVDYPFYLPYTVNNTQLDIDARSELSKRSLSVLPVACQTSLKKAVCGFLYPRCSSGESWKWSNMSTWSYETINIVVNSSSTVADNTSSPSPYYLLLPYQRPCFSLCTDLEESCYGLLSSLLDIGLITSKLRNCSSLVSYSPMATGPQALSFALSSSSSSSFMRQYSSYWNPWNVISVALYANDTASNSTCNSLPGSAGYTVANTTETYLYAQTATTTATTTTTNSSYGACTGIISQLYVPSYGFQWGDNSDSDFDSEGEGVDDDVVDLAPMQSPYTYQRAVERRIELTLSALPLWLDSRCYLATREYLCSIGMQGAQSVPMSVYREYISGSSFLVAPSSSSSGATSGVTSSSFAEFVRAYDAYVPTYPARSICEGYVSACGTFLSKWGSTFLDADNSSTSSFASLLLYPNCELQQSVTTTTTATDSSGGGGSGTTTVTSTTLDISLFPTSSQTVLNLLQSIDEGGGFSTELSQQLTSWPNTLPDLLSSGVSFVQSMWATTCPKVFVVPEDLYNTRNIWVVGTGCAEPCRGSAIPSGAIDTIGFWVPLVGIIWLGIQMLAWAFDPRFWKANYLLMIIGFMLILMCIAVLLSGSTSKQKNKVYCLNNAVRRQQSDEGSGTCTAQALLMIYTLLAVVASWFMHILDLFSKLVLERKESITNSSDEGRKKKVAFHLVFTFLLPLIPVFYNGVIANATGFSGSFYPFCSATTAVGIFSWVLFYIPILTMALIGSIMLLWIIVKSFLLFRKTRKAMRRVINAAAVMINDDALAALSVVGNTASNNSVLASGPAAAQQQQQQTSTIAATEQQRNPFFSSPLLRVIAISLDMILFDFILLTMYMYTISVLAQRNFLGTAKDQESYDIWETCVMNNFAAYESNSEWVSACGALPALQQREQKSLIAAAFCSVAPALVMAMCSMLGRVYRRFVTPPAREPLIRNRWLIPNTVRLFAMRPSLPIPSQMLDRLGGVVSVAAGGGGGGWGGEPGVLATTGGRGGGDGGGGDPPRAVLVGGGGEQKSASSSSVLALGVRGVSRPPERVARR